MEIGRLEVAGGRSGSGVRRRVSDRVLGSGGRRGEELGINGDGNEVGRSRR